ncbi:hypothetical protein ACIBEA_35285 [Streptomyces sp. NPDC051555]|uniref:hypothetical protein n=1 Tax=Streptomyces sp. NPDC051555 TaxID=3365657 RepID=UPI00378BEF2B
MSAPPCPRCGRELEPLPVHHTRNRWGGGPPRPRSELWWTCPAGDWLGWQNPNGGPLHTMRLWPGNCPFCGEDDTTWVGEPWQREDGEWRDWVVCLDCGTSNPRRIPPPATP